MGINYCLLVFVWLGIILLYFSFFDLVDFVDLYRFMMFYRLVFIVIVNISFSDIIDWLFEE